MTASKHKSKSKPLSAGRPPNAQKPKAALSAIATRTLIRTHHRLHKQLHKASSAGDVTHAQALQQQIDDLGGLKSYQQASILGQAKDRGGDSSLILMQWLHSAKPLLRDQDPKHRMLEVGALSTTNACSESKLFEIERIDLNSQGDGILCQDFMKRPLPTQEKERFNIISLSLVLNYVPDAVQRGEMLKRTCQFLHSADNIIDIFPALFLVLPAPCVTNSRYLDDNRLGQIMDSLGYRLVKQKRTAKLVYYLWHLVGRATYTAIPKLEVNPGTTRNNFAVILQ